MARREIGTRWDRENRNNINENFKELYDVQDRAIEEATQSIIDSAKLIWLEPVNTFTDIPTTYPNPEVGHTVFVRDTGKVYRFYNGSWMEIQQIDAGPVNEVDTRLSAEIEENRQEIEQARTKADGTTFPVLRDRLNDVDDKIGILNKKTDGFVSVKEFGAKGDGVTDDTDAIQEIIAYVMKNGGGTVYFPPGDYLINGTIYTHMDDYTSNDGWSPLTLLGATPVSFSLYNPMRNVSRLIKRNSGDIICVNHTPTKETFLSGSSVYRNFKVRNLAFYGSGTRDTKYTDVYATTEQTNGISLYRTSIDIEDCLFDILDWGIYAPLKLADGSDNYCDQSNFDRLGFRNMGTGWIQMMHADASHFGSLYGYNMAMTCLYGVRNVKSESCSIKRLLVAGLGMHHCKSFRLVDAYYCNSIRIGELYTERVEGQQVYLDECFNVDINTLSARHYAGTYVRGRNTRNVRIHNVHTFVEEGKVLSPNDDGTYTTYDNVTPPVDFDFDNTCYNIEYGQMIFRHGVHSGGSFNQQSVRFFPRVNKTAYCERGQEYVLTVFYDSGAGEIRARANGANVNWQNLLGISAPTFNAGSGEVVFPTTGIFANQPTLTVSARRSPSGVVNIPVIINNNTIRLYKQDGSLVALEDVAFGLSIRF